MGNCFVKRESLPNNSPAIYPDAHGLYSSSQANFKTHVSSSSLGFNGRTCTAGRDLSVPCSCSVNYAQMQHDSMLMKTAIPEQGGSVKQPSFKLAHLLQKSFVENGETRRPPLEVNVTATISPILRSKSSGKSSGGGLEDPVHSKSESPRSKVVGLIVNQLVKSLSSVRSNSVKCSGNTKVDTFNSDMIFNGKAADGISKESTGLSSRLRQINIARNCHSRSSGMCRSYSLAVEGEKAFGSPLSIESNNLWERTRECSTFDEFSDSSSDLFDIDFLKPELVAGVTFSMH